MSNLPNPQHMGEVPRIRGRSPADREALARAALRLARQSIATLSACSDDGEVHRSAASLILEARSLASLDPLTEDLAVGLLRAAARHVASRRPRVAG